MDRIGRSGLVGLMLMVGLAGCQASTGGLIARSA